MKQTESQRNNLRKWTAEEARELGKKGQAKSVEARKRNRDFRELARAFLSSSVPEEQEEVIRQMQAMGICGEELRYDNAILAAQVKSALKGNPESAKFLRDTAGYAPTQVISMDADVKVDEDVQIYMPQLEEDNEEEKNPKNQKKSSKKA